MQLPLTFKNNTTPNKKQRGDFLIEALIGVLLIGIVGVGITQTATQITKGQADLEKQDLVASQLKSLVINGDPNIICKNNFKVRAYSEIDAVKTKLDGAALCQAGTTQYKTIAGMSINGQTIEAPAPVILTASIPVTAKNGTTQLVDLRVGQISAKQTN